MPSPSYEQNKIHIYKWRETNIERNKEINRRARLKQYTKQKAWKEIKMEFLSILLY